MEASKATITKEFRAALIKAMPGYNWTVHKSTDQKPEQHFHATGIQTSGFNRLSTISVERISDHDGDEYHAKSSGFGLKAPWLGSGHGNTLAQALRNLQNFYEKSAANFASHAKSLETARTQKS